MSKNIIYSTDQIDKFFKKNRISWPQLYKSERLIIASLGLKPVHSILDIGCGCGGLGLILKQKYSLIDYTGVEINVLAADTARFMNDDAKIFSGDFLELKNNKLSNCSYDFVFSLSCFDWNVQFDEMLNASWQHVLPGGKLVVTLRLTADDGCDDINRSYQYINYDGERKGECAAYVVLNSKILFEKLVAFNPLSIKAFGYWGAPSSTAVTCFDKLCFAAISITKRLSSDLNLVSMHLDLPEDLKINLTLS